MLGFVGLGHMGGAIVLRLLAQGREVMVFDPDAQAMTRAVQAGARPASSIPEICEAAPLVMACLPSAGASHEVALAVAGTRRPIVYAELSTIGRDAIVALDRLLASSGIFLVDAPVSGGPAGAERGTLSIMLAGSTEAADAVAAAATPFAGHILRIGETPGQAQLCKLVNNGISMTAFLVSCEAIAVGVSAGIDAAVLVDVVNAGTGRNTATTDKIPRFILPRTFNMGAPLGSALKDLDLYLGEAQAAGLPSGVIAETRALWARAVDALDPAEDAATVARYFERFVGAELSSGVGPAGQPGRT